MNNGRREFCAVASAVVHISGLHRVHVYTENRKLQVGKEMLGLRNAERVKCIIIQGEMFRCLVNIMLIRLLLFESQRRLIKTAPDYGAERV